MAKPAVDRSVAGGRIVAEGRAAVLVFKISTGLIVLSGLSALIGTFVPWARVTSGVQLRSLLNLTFSLSVSGIDIDARYGWGLVLGGVISVGAALWLATRRTRARAAAIMATAAALTTASAALALANQGQSAGTSVGWVGSLIDTSALITLTPGVGFWVVLVGSVFGLAGGLLAYWGR